MAMKKSMKKATPKKAASESGSDRGATTKAKEAKRKSVAANARYANNDLAGRVGRGNALLPSGNSGFVGQYFDYAGRTWKRGADQAKRADAKKLPSAKKVAKGKK